MFQLAENTKSFRKYHNIFLFHRFSFVLMCWYMFPSPAGWSSRFHKQRILWFSKKKVYNNRFNRFVVHAYHVANPSKWKEIHYYTSQLLTPCIPSRSRATTETTWRRPTLCLTGRTALRGARSSSCVQPQCVSWCGWGRRTMLCPWRLLPTSLPCITCPSWWLHNQTLSTLAHIFSRNAHNSKSYWL